MTTRLYYHEPYRTTFEGLVTSCAKDGDRFQVVLDRTAFYPTSGGQPFDTGTLGASRVLDVVDREDGEIAHIVDTEIDVGARIRGEIDWGRRFDHMQQHTGQHVLSAAFDRLLDARTESFHLGSVSSTIDLGRELSPPELAAAEDEANRVVWEDRPVIIRFVTAEEAATLPLRKDPTRTGELRLVEIENFDVSACGGTHVARTGAVGLVAIAGAEKVRGGTRVEFLCGSRALARFRAWRDAFAGTQRVLSVPPQELAAGVDRLQGELKSAQRAIKQLQERLAVHEARALVARGVRTAKRVVIVESIEGSDAMGLKALALAAAAADPHAAVALFSATPPALVVVARGNDGGIDASAVLKQLVSRFGGRGGGKPDLAQGGGLAGELASMLEVAHAALKQ